jgi:hypothetical protein
MAQPGAIYYLSLFVLIITLQFWRTFQVVKDNPTEHTWREYFHVSLQVLYTSAGVAILLIGELKEWIPVIMMVYIGLVVSSSYLDTTGKKFKQSTQFAVHVFIIIFVVIVTLYSYEKILPRKNIIKDIQKPVSAAAIAHNYKVAFPYIDRTLVKHVGSNKMRETLLYFATIVKGTSRDDALLKAKLVALNVDNDNAAIRLFNPSQKGKEGKIQLFTEQSVVEDLP